MRRVALVVGLALAVVAVGCLGLITVTFRSTHNRDFHCRQLRAALEAVYGDTTTPPNLNAKHMRRLSPPEQALARSVIGAHTAKPADPAWDTYVAAYKTHAMALHGCS